MIAATQPSIEATILATNILRFMAHHDLTFELLCDAAGVDERTMRGIVKQRAKPQWRTVERIAQALGVSVQELYKPASAMAGFDQATNTLVEQVVAQHRETFADWQDAEYRELCSNFGVGGQMTEDGVLAIAQRMNMHRDIRRKVRVILQSSDAELLVVVVTEMYRRIAGRAAPAIAG